jgi:hypothetical protein
MDSSYEDSPLVVLGTTILAYVEIIPIVSLQETESLSQRAVALAFTSKTKLQQISKRCKLQIKWDAFNFVGATGKRDKARTDELIATSSKDRPLSTWGNPNRLQRGFLVSMEQEEAMHPITKQLGYPTISFPSEDPLEVEPIPSLVIGYAIDKLKNGASLANTSPRDAVILDGTLVRVLPPMRMGRDIQRPLETGTFPTYRSFLDELIGEQETPNLPDHLKKEIVCNHDSKAIQQLELRMSLLLAEPIRIGTTEDALTQLERQQRRQKLIGATIQTYCLGQAKDSLHQIPQSANDGMVLSMNSSVPALLRDGALLVHSPDHAAGKTTLVKYIAKYRLMCDSVHVIQPAALLAKYGSQADAGLESMMHAITMSAAIKGRASICIILDHFNAMMPPTFSATSGAGDAAVPVLHAIGK